MTKNNRNNWSTQPQAITTPSTEADPGLPLRRRNPQATTHMNVWVGVYQVGAGTEGNPEETGAYPEGNPEETGAYPEGNPGVKEEGWGPNPGAEPEREPEPQGGVHQTGQAKTWLDPP